MTDQKLLTGLEALVHKVVVTELKDDTFYAVIWLEREGRVISIDSRPSDALALGAPRGLPDLCRRRGFEDLEAVGQSRARVSSEELRKYLEDLGDDDLGKYKM